MMKDAPIIILDEATANVDPENEKELMDAVRALTCEKTVIMIAHRLKTVRRADQILVIDKGRIVQRGHARRAAGAERDLPAFYQQPGTGGQLEAVAKHFQLPAMEP